VYWTDAAGIHAGPKAGQGTVANLSSAVPDVMVQDSSRIYGIISYGPWGAGSVFSVDKATGALFTIFSGGVGAVPNIFGIAVDDVDVYYFSFNAHGSPPLRNLNRQSKATGANADYDALYWTNESGRSDNMLAEHCLVYWSDGNVIFKQVPGGSVAQAVTTAASAATAIALDDKYLYWADQSFVGRVPK
jgi:hypothetical protein